LGADGFDCCARCQRPSATSPGWPRPARCHSRFRAARPVTFLALPRKVTKRRRSREVGRCAAALRCSCGPAAIETCTISRLRREPRASDSRWPTAPDRTALLGDFEGMNAASSPHSPGPSPHPGQGVRRVRALASTSGGRGWAGFNAFKDAEQRRTSRSLRASTVRSTWLGTQCRDRASFDARRLVRVAQGTAIGGDFAGTPFFGYFLWQDKESNGPRGPEAHLGSKSTQAARSAKKNCATC
jgi:hypothetical protein